MDRFWPGYIIGTINALITVGVLFLFAFTGEPSWFKPKKGPRSW